MLAYLFAGEWSGIYRSGPFAFDQFAKQVHRGAGGAGGNGKAPKDLTGRGPFPPAHFIPITPAGLSAASSSAFKPRISFSTSAVCWPMTGAGVRILAGVLESRTGLPTDRTLPTRG